MFDRREVVVFSRNHSGRSTRSCHSRCSGIVSPHWLTALTVMPSIAAKAVIDPAISIAVFVSIVSMDRSGLKFFTLAMLSAFKHISQVCFKLQLRASPSPFSWLNWMP